MLCVDSLVFFLFPFRSLQIDCNNLLALFTLLCKFLLHHSGLPACFKYQHYYSFIRFVYCLLVLGFLLIILTSHIVERVLDSMHKRTVVRAYLGDIDRRKVTCYPYVVVRYVAIDLLSYFASML